MQVEYADGEVESVLLAAEDVRVLLPPCHPLPPPNAAEMHAAGVAVTVRANAGGSNNGSIGGGGGDSNSNNGGDVSRLLQRGEAIAVASAAAAVAEAERASPTSPAVGLLPSHVVSAVRRDAGMTKGAAGVTVGSGGRSGAGRSGGKGRWGGRGRGFGRGRGSGKGRGRGRLPTPDHINDDSKAGGYRGSGSGGAAGLVANDEPYLPGEVVWCMVRGWCHWPALVMTHLHLDDQKAPRKPPAKPLSSKLESLVVSHSSGWYVRYLSAPL